jgi:hypothetical protein
MPLRFLRGAAAGVGAAGAAATMRGAGSGAARLRDEAGLGLEGMEAARIRRVAVPAALAGTGLKNLESSWSIELKERVSAPPSGLNSRGGAAVAEEVADDDDDVVEDEVAPRGGNKGKSDKESSSSSPPY